MPHRVDHVRSHLLQSAAWATMPADTRRLGWSRKVDSQRLHKHVVGLDIGLLLPRLLDRASFGKKIGKFRFKDTEFVAPGISHYPKVTASRLLVIPAGRAKRFEATHFGFHIVSFEVKVHPLFADLRVSGELEKHTYLGIRETKTPVDLAARGVDRFLCGFEGGGPESSALVEVANIDHEVRYAAAVRTHALSASTRA